MYPQNNMYYYQPQQMPPYQPNPSPSLKGRPVSSIEEAKAANIDFDGSIFFFPDAAHKRIYTKQINMDGTATLLMYELQEMPTATASTDYITREEFEKAIQALQNGQKPAPITNQF